MSVVFGLVSLDSEPVARRDLEGMNAALAAHGPDGADIWTQGSIGLGQRLTRFTPEDLFERQPLVSGDGHRVLVSAGRVDNRPELMRKLDLSPAEGREAPDSLLILRAYEKWSEACLGHLIGAFAFALWDARIARLLLVRSPFGAPPLFYHKGPRRLAFGTMPKALFALPFVSREIDLQSIADWLTITVNGPRNSFFRDIHRLQGGHSLLLQGGAVTIRPYWQLDLRHELRLPRDEDYVAAFNEQFERVVADNLRSLTPIGIFMSGGLDSTSVAATAAPLLAREGKRLTAFTGAPRSGFDGSIPAGKLADETPLARAMAARYPNLDLNIIRAEGRVFLEGLETFFAAAEAVFPGTSNRVWWEAVLEEARHQGVRVLLSGIAGNWTISWNGSGLLPQLLRAGRWGQALREASAAAKQNGGRSAVRVLASQGLLPLLPRPFWLCIQRWRNRKLRSFTGDALWSYSPIHPEFARAQQVEARARENQDDLHGRPQADKRRVRYDYLRKIGSFGEIDAAYGAMFGIDTRDPTADVRLVEFCLSLPESQYQRAGTSRWLIRRAMADRLPAEILANKHRGLQSADYLERLCAARSEVLEELRRLERSELARTALDLARMRRLAEQMPHVSGDAFQMAVDYRGVLERGLMIGRFLRWFESGK